MVFEVPALNVVAGGRGEVPIAPTALAGGLTGGGVPIGAKLPPARAGESPSGSEF